MKDPQVLGFALDEKGAKVPIYAKPVASDADNEWKCKGCSDMMGPSADKYCGKCAADDEEEPDEDDDEEEAIALGLDKSAKRADRLGRVAALVAFEKAAFAALGVTTADEAKGKIVAASEALRDIAGEREKSATAERESIRHTLRITLERGLTANAGKAPTLSLAAVQSTIPLFVANEEKRASMQAAIAHLITASDQSAADAVKAGKPASDAEVKVTRDALLDAVCSVDITASDLRTIQGYAKASAPIAAGTHDEPQRNAVNEAAELDETEKLIKNAADATRATLDRAKSATTKK
jgi:hypothetical protein